MLPHQERVVVEKRELDEKITKLTLFKISSVFSSLPSDEQDRLSRQFDCMIKYSSILRERIDAFKIGAGG
jgi:hypothetical protein